MAYQDRRRDGTYRGLPFKLRSTTLEIGRRTAVYEIPGSELGAGHVDNGRRAWRKNIEFIVIGTDYDLDRDEMIEAFERSGAGELVHPYYGTKNIVVDGAVSITETSDTGGMAVFSFTAVEVAKQSTPASSLDTGGALLAAIAAAELSMLDSFEEGFNASATAENFVRTDALSVLDDVLKDIRGVTGTVGSILDAPSRLNSQIDAITRELTTLINAPRDLLASVVGVMANLKSSIQSLGNAIGGYSNSVRQSAEIGSAVLPLDAPDTPGRRQQGLNTRQVKDKMKGVTLLAMAGAAVDFEFSDASEANDIRDQLTGALDDLLAEQDAVSTDLERTLYDAGSLEQPAVYQDLRRVQSTLYDHLSAVAGDATQVSDYTPAEPLPSVVIAYQLYGDASRHTEIEDRNVDVVRHPGFVPGSVTIGVLAE